MSSGAQKKLDDNYELNFEVLDPPPKSIQDDVGTLKKMNNEPEIQITSTDEFASAEIKNKLQPGGEIQSSEPPVGLQENNTPPLTDSIESAEESPTLIESQTSGSKKIKTTSPLTSVKTDSPRNPNPPPSKTMPSSYSSPTSSSYTRNVERQSREQKSMNNLLSGVGLFLLVLVLIVGASAGFGGYVIWKQIQDQAVTVNQLDVKYAAAVSALNQNLTLSNEQIAAHQSALSALREETASLKSQLAASSSLLRSTQRDLDNQKTRVQQLERTLDARTRSVTR